MPAWLYVGIRHILDHGLVKCHFLAISMIVETHIMRAGVSADVLFAHQSFGSFTFSDLVMLWELTQV